MKKIRILLFLSFVLCLFTAQAQLITTVPEIIQEDSKNISIIFKASEGNAGMKGSTTCYAHTGVITNKSNGEWAHAPQWGDNSDKYKLKLKGTNKWELKIADIRQYYGITDPSEKVLKLAFVFRSKDCTKEGKTADGGDIFVEVHAAGAAVSLTSNANGNILDASSSNVTFNLSSTVSGTLSLYKNSVSSTPLKTLNGTSLSYTYNMSAVGDYDIIGEVKAGNQVKRDTLSFCRRGESKNVSYSGELKQGATINADGSVTFCLLAPKKKNVMLIGEWNNYKPSNTTLMNYQGDKFFWTTVKGLDLNKEYAYYYIVDDNINVADPYATKILDPWSDKYINEKEMVYPNLKPFPAKLGNFIIAVFEGKKAPYNWNVKNFNKPAKENLVIYEMLLRDFTDNRTIKAATAKLDYIKNLGVNAIELMPVQEFNGNNSWGYNPNFYFAPDKAYGTEADYKKFIDECHKRGIAVILDVVFNHTWGDHPWCRMYWDAAKSVPSADNPFYNTAAPHNWSVGNDWKQENVNVQNHFCDILKYWIKEYKVDGYRFDLVKGLGDSNSYGGDYDGNRYNASRIKNLRRLADAIKSADKNAYCIFEAFVDHNEEKEYGKFGAMSWRKMVDPAQNAAAGRQADFNGMNDQEHFWVSFMESHDEERNAYYQKMNANPGIKGNTAVSMRRLGSNAALALLSPGAKMIWQFGEMGYDESIDSHGGRTDPKPTHWEYLDNADRNGLMKSYSEIATIRTANPDLFTGEFYASYAFNDWTNGRFITARNASKTKELVVVVNPNSATKTFDYTFKNPNGAYYMNSHSFGVTPSFDAKAGKVTVPAHSYVVITNMADPTGGVEDVLTDAVEEANITVYPNPATDVVFVNSDDVEEISVYSLTGAMVANSREENSVDVSDLTSGTYLVRVQNSNGAVATAKLIKK